MDLLKLFTAFALLSFEAPGDRDTLYGTMLSIALQN